MRKTSKPALRRSSTQALKHSSTQAPKLPSAQAPHAPHAPHAPKRAETRRNAVAPWRRGAGQAAPGLEPVAWPATEGSRRCSRSHQKPRRCVLCKLTEHEIEAGLVPLKPAASRRHRRDQPGHPTTPEQRARRCGRRAGLACGATGDRQPTRRCPRDPGPLARRRTGAPAHRRVGAPAHRRIGTSAHRHTGTPAHPRAGRRSRRVSA